MPERDRPLMIPEVTVCCRPKGLPMATTKSPTSDLAESPSATCDRPSGLTFRTATSEGVSLPTTSALRSRPSCSVTVISLAFSTTCALVTI